MTKFPIFISTSPSKNLLYYREGNEQARFHAFENSSQVLATFKAPGQNESNQKESMLLLNGAMVT